MKKNEESLKAAMDRRLSFLDELPSCRASLQYRIAREEEPVMKKKISVGFVFAMALVVLSVAALAAGLLLSVRASAVQAADRALAEKYGITTELQTFFGREEEELEDGGVKVSYTGAGNLSCALGTYTVLVKDGRAEAAWSHDGEDTSGGYEAEAWGLDQLKQMFADCGDAKLKAAYTAKAEAIAERHGALEDDSPSEADEHYHEKREAAKTAAKEARKVSEEEMIAAAREFVIGNYGLSEEQAGEMELYTNSYPVYSGEEGEGPADPRDTNEWYETVNGKPCFLVEYLLDEESFSEECLKDENYVRNNAYFKVYVNVETGMIEQYEYSSGIGGRG